jgi:hypothetical protein
MCTPRSSNRRERHLADGVVQAPGHPEENKDGSSTRRMAPPPRRRPLQEVAGSRLRRGTRIVGGGAGRDYVSRTAPEANRHLRLGFMSTIRPGPPACMAIESASSGPATGPCESASRRGHCSSWSLVPGRAGFASRGARCFFEGSKTGGRAAAVPVTVTYQTRSSRAD